MKGKVNCTCGWSWNKSDSSAKDMYICHECGRDNSNNMKNGGWLDNYNDSQASAPEGMKGDGYSNVGRDYSPAWGGQFQMGGNVYPVNYVPQAQEGIKTYSYPKREPYSSELEFLKTNPNVGGMATEDNKVIINPYSPLSDEQKQGIIINEVARLAMRNGYERPTFELTPEQQEYFNTMNNGKPYSTDEQDIRETIIGRILSGDDSAGNVTPEQKKYAEELQKVLKYQTGGSIPGATGSMYARVGAPSNGPYAKKTMASAQTGIKLDFSKGPTGKMKESLEEAKQKNKKKNIKEQNITEKDNLKINIPIQKEQTKKQKIKSSINDQSRFMKDWMNSPMYDKMVDNSTTGYFDKQYLNSGRNSNFNNTGVQLQPQPKLSPNTGADSNNQTGLIRLFPLGTQSDALEGMVAHEYSHSSDRPMNWQTAWLDKFKPVNKYDNDKLGLDDEEEVRLIPEKDINLMKLFYSDNKSYKNLFNKSALKDKDLNKNREWFNYVSEPTETRARLNDIRYNAKKYNIYDPFTQKVTPEILNKIKELTKKAGGFNPFMQLKSVYSDDEILHLLNNISQNEQPDQNPNIATAQNGVVFDKNGKRVFPNIKKDLQVLTNIQNRNKKNKKYEIKDESLQAVTKVDNTAVKKPNFDLERSKENKTYNNAYNNALVAQKEEDARRAKLTQDQREREDYNAYNEEHGTITKTVPETNWERTKAIVSNPMTAIGYKVRNENIPPRFQHGPRNEHDYAVDWINPLQGIAALSNIPGQLGRGEFLDAGLSGLDALDLGVYVRGAKKLGSNQIRNLSPAMGMRDGGTITNYPEAQLGALIKKGVKAVGNKAKLVKKDIKTSAKNYSSLLKDLPKAKSLKEAAGRVAGLPIKETLPRLSPEELKIFRQVQEIGRMRATGKPISQQYKYALEQGLPEEHLKKAFGKTKAEIENAIPNAQEQEAFRLANPIRDRINLQRPPRTTSSSDAAIDQMNASVGSDQDIENVRAMFDHLRTQSITSPPVLQTNSSMFRMDPSILANLTNQVNPSKAQNFAQQAVAPIRDVSNAASSRFMNMVQDYPYHAGHIQQNVPSLSLRGSGSLKNVSDKVTDAGTKFVKSGDVYTGSLNTSHSSYLPQLKQVFKSTEGAPQFFGYRPMNSMGFLSDFNYSKNDIAKYLNTEIDEQIKRGIIPDNVQRPYSKGNDVFLPHYGIKQFREGGIIDSDRGQWDHPGEITRINSNQITMGPDPKTGKPLTKPLLGISDTGDVKLMRPGGNYKFDGKRVTEYPIAQGGLTMGTTSTENDVRESSAQAAKANTEAKKQAKLNEAKLLAEQKENKRNLFPRDIKIQQPDGTIKIVNTGSPEYAEMYKAGSIQSPGAGEGDTPFFGGQLNDVVVQQKMTPLLKGKKDYGYLSNKEAFVNRKKDEYIKSLGSRGNWFGATRSNFPETVLSRINREYDYNQNTRAIEDVAKAKGFDLNTRGEWIYNLTPGEKEALINSKYSAQLNPNEFSEMASGVQQLANTLVPGKPWNFKIPGLTERELEEDRESWMSPLKIAAPFNMPGNFIANSFTNIPGSDVVDTPWFGMQRQGDVSALEAMALNPLNLTMVEGAANLLTRGLPALAKGVPAAARTIGKGVNLAIENAPAAVNFAADAVKDVRGVVKQYKEISKIKNQDDYYNSVVNTSKYIDDIPKTGIDASNTITDVSDLNSVMRTIANNYMSYLKRMGGEEFAIKEARKWEKNFDTSDLGTRMSDVIYNGKQVSVDELRQLGREFSNSFPKGKSLIAPAKNELAKIQKNIIFNRDKDYDTLKEFAKNLKIKIPKIVTEYSPQERETISAIRELGKYKTVANWQTNKLLSDPEAMVSINKLILKLDDDVIQNLLGISKGKLLDSYKNIVPNIKKTQVDITSNPIPTADLSLVNEQNLVQPSGVSDIHPFNEKQLIASDPKYQSLIERIGQSYAKNFEPVNYEIPSSNPQGLIRMAKTDYEYMTVRDAQGNLVEKLLPTGKTKEQLIGAVRKVEASPKGTNFIGSSSLSTDSYPLTLDSGLMMSEKGLVDVSVDTGTMYLNDMGYTHTSPRLVIKDINSKIEQLEKISGKKFPRAKYNPKADRYHMYEVPKIYFTRLKQGGSINKTDENSLVKLDQLTNFTNYNKPQPGGWLSKYE